MIDTEALLKHGTFVRSLAQSLVRDAHTAEDLTQDTYLAALQRPPRHQRNLRGWFGAVTRNLARLHGRGEVRRLARERGSARPAMVPGAGEVVERLDWEQHIVEAVRDLEEPYRSTIVYRFFEQMDPAAIARRMGVPRKTVYTRTQRALDRLRKRFDRDAGGRRAWCAALLPLAFDHKTVSAATAATAATTAGGVAMTKTGVVLTAGLVTASFFTGWTVKPERAAPKRTAAATTSQWREDRPTTPNPVPASPAEPATDVTVSGDAQLVRRYVERVQEAKDSWTGVIAIAWEITELAPDRGRDVMRAVFKDVKSPKKRRQILKAFTIDDGHPHSIEILHLGATDPDAGVREWALSYLSEFAFRDFRRHPDTYPAWHATQKGRPLRDVVRESAAEFVRRVSPLGGEELRDTLHTFESLELEGNEACAAWDLPGVMKRAGLLDAATSWLKREDLNPGARHIVHGWIRSLNPDEAYLRRVYLPALERPEESGDDFYAATLAMRREEHRWTVEPLLATYERVSTLGRYRAISDALADIGDPRAIPTMIAVIVADDTVATTQGVGRPLSRLADVEHNRSHDGAWWLAWWETNRHRYPDARFPSATAR